MGLNIGIRVNRQEENIMSYGNNPKGTREEVQSSLETFLNAKFPGVTSPTVSIADAEYTFDVSLSYHWNDYDSTPMYLALLEYVLRNFSTMYGIDLHIYNNP